MDAKRNGKDALPDEREAGEQGERTMAVNTATVIGNLGADPQVRALPSGQSVATLSLATTERFTDRNGGKQQRTKWHRIVAFGKLADSCAQYATARKSSPDKSAFSDRARMLQTRLPTTHQTTRTCPSN